MDAWAPPAPGSAHVVTPRPAVCDLPSLPVATAPTLAVAALPVTPESPTAPVSAFVQPTTAATVAPDVSDVPDAVEDRPTPPRDLVATRSLRLGVICTASAASAAVFLGSVVSFAIGALAASLLLLWCALAVTNVRRSRAATKHHRPPHPLAAVLWWFAAPALAIGGGVLLVVVSEWVDRASFEQESSRSTVFVLVAVGTVLSVAIAAYVPYAVLGRASRWVGGNSAKMRMWFGAPIIAALIALTVQILSTLTVVADSADGDPSGSTATATWLIVLSVGLPSLAWLIAGSRAMIDLEEATQHQHARAVRESEPHGAEIDAAAPPFAVARREAVGVSVPTP